MFKRNNYFVVFNRLQCSLQIVNLYSDFLQTVYCRRIFSSTFILFFYFQFSASFALYNRKLVTMEEKNGNFISFYIEGKEEKEELYKFINNFFSA